MRNLNLSVIPFVLLLVSALIQSGCGSGADRMVVRPVSGVVLIDGKQTGGVELQFHPVSEAIASFLIFPRAITDDQGRFVLATYEQADGIPEGEYKVTASWRELDSSDPEEMHPDEVSRARERLAARFTDPETTPLQAHVVGGSNKLGPFNLLLAD